MAGHEITDSTSLEVVFQLRDKENDDINLLQTGDSIVTLASFLQAFTPQTSHTCILQNSLLITQTYIVQVS